ncbi:Hypothetical predicted protein [Pelobates cultripes]|uniref:Uncharacterized protein n=1 Tax=Pelobates cultripes TaxID=61616 RepID=A0AAD1RVE3_PELCU|nr:Hypothetical predicted protein [Pelobates cultripes]
MYKILFQFQLTKKTYYEFRNKSGKLLARALRARRQKSHVQKISGKTFHTPTTITKGFQQYYSLLHCLPARTPTPGDGAGTLSKQQKAYIAHYMTTKLEAHSTAALEENITREKLHLAIKLAKARKSPVQTFLRHPCPTPPSPLQ